MTPMILRGAFVVLLLTAPAACTPSSGGSGGDPRIAVPEMDLETLRQHSRNLQQYVTAMLLCGSTQARDWEDAKRQFEVLHPLYVFKEDPQLIKDFRAGGEAARKELARRGVLLQSMLVFAKGTYDR